MAVTGDAGGFVHYCLTHSNQTVEKRTLTYIRSAYYCY